VRVHHRALQAELAHPALHFLDRVAGVVRSDGGEAGIAVRMLADRLAQYLIGLPRERGTGRRVEDLHAGRGEEQQLLRDPARVHVGDAPRAEVLDALGERRGARRRAEEEAPQAAEAGVPGLGLVLQELLVATEEIGRRPGFFAGDADHCGWIFAIST
jgi:hypothetical protein